MCDIVIILGQVTTSDGIATKELPGSIKDFVDEEVSTSSSTGESEVL